MTDNSQFMYESNAPIETSDNYFLQVKAHVETKVDASNLLRSSINSSSVSFFKELSLFDALGMLENAKGELTDRFNQKVVADGLKNQIEITKFVLTTIDAVQGSTDSEEVNLEINPELEGKKKKKGLFGKLFGKK